MFVITETGRRLRLEARPRLNAGLLRWGALGLPGAAAAAAFLAFRADPPAGLVWLQAVLASAGIAAAVLAREPVSVAFDREGIETVDRFCLLPMLRRTARVAGGPVAVEGGGLRAGELEMRVDVAGIETDPDRRMFAGWVEAALSGGRAPGWAERGEGVEVERREGRFEHAERAPRRRIAAALGALACTLGVAAGALLPASRDGRVAAAFAGSWPGLAYVAFACGRHALGPGRRRVVVVDETVVVDGTAHLREEVEAVVERDGVAYLAGPPDHPRLGEGIGAEIAGRIRRPLRRA